MFRTEKQRGADGVVHTHQGRDVDLGADKTADVAEHEAAGSVCQSVGSAQYEGGQAHLQGAVCASRDVYGVLLSEQGMPQQGLLTHR